MMFGAVFAYYALQSSIHGIELEVRHFRTPNKIHRGTVPIRYNKMTNDGDVMPVGRGCFSLVVNCSSPTVLQLVV